MSCILVFETSTEVLFGFCSQDGFLFFLKKIIKDRRMLWRCVCILSMSCCFADHGPYRGCCGCELRTRFIYRFAYRCIYGKRNLLWT